MFLDKKIGIVDTDNSFIRRFVTLMNSKYEDIEIIVFPSVKAAQTAASKSALNLLLLDSSYIAKFNLSIPLQCEVVVLVNSDDEGAGFALPTMCKYKSMDEWHKIICQFCIPLPLEETTRGGCLGNGPTANGATCLFLPCDGSNGAITAATDFCHFLYSYGKKVAAFSPYDESGEALWTVAESIALKNDVLALCVNDWNKENVVIPFINSNLVILVTDGSKAGNNKVEESLIAFPQITGESKQDVYRKTALLYNNFDSKTGMLIKNEELLKFGGLDVPRNSKAAFEKMVAFLNV